VRALYDRAPTRCLVQEDPTGYDGGNNVYAYGDGSPLQGTDPSGMIFNAINIFNFGADESVHTGPEVYMDGADVTGMFGGAGMDAFARGSVSEIDATTPESENGILASDMLTSMELVMPKGCSSSTACALAYRILGNSAIVQGIRDDYAASELDGRERGGYILEDTGDLSLGKLVIGHQGGFDPGAFGPIPWDAVAMFHTHPDEGPAPANVPMSSDIPPYGLALDLVVGRGGVIAVGQAGTGYYFPWSR
jgi:hypothetical protein